MTAQEVCRVHCGTVLQARYAAYVRQRFGRNHVLLTRLLSCLAAGNRGSMHPAS